MGEIKTIRELDTHRIAYKKKYKPKPRKPRGDSPKRIIRLSHEEVSDAVKAYLKDGGRIEKIVLENRDIKDVPIHYEDKFL